MDLDAAREGIATQLRNGLNGIQVSAQRLSSPDYPYIDVFPGEINYDGAMVRGHDDTFLTVRLLVSIISDIGAQKTLDAYLAGEGANSVKAAIETKAAGENTVTLGGVCDDVRVVSCSGYQEYRTAEGIPLLGAEWRVHVLG